MNSVSKLPRRFLAGIALVLVFGVAPRAEIVEQVLVKVNGDILSKTDLEQRQVTAIRQMGSQNRPSDTQLRKILDELTPSLLVDTIDELLLVQRGRELGMKLTDDQFKTAIDNIKKENNIETEEQFQAALRQEKMTMTELRAGLERQMLVQTVRKNEVIGRVGVTEEESRRYYDAHPGEFTSVPSVTLREILVSAPADGTGDAAAKAKADQIRQRALAGEPFEKLATELSDSPSKANAGLVGPLSLGDLSDDLRTLLASMKQNDVTPVLKTAAGFQVLKLEAISAADTKPFALAKPDIDNKVFDMKMQDETERYMVKLRSQAIIEWKNPDLKKAYEQGLKARPQPSAAPATK